MVTPATGSGSSSSAPRGHGVGIPSSWISWLFSQSENSEEWGRKDIAVWGTLVTRAIPICPLISLGNLVLFSGVKGV